MNTKNFLLAIFACSLLFAGCSGPTFTQPTRPQVKESATTTSSYSHLMSVGNQKIYVEKVDTNETRQKGLSGREKLEAGQGMLFDFTDTALKQPSFWMKDMKFAIDIIWIKNNEVIGITPSVQPPFGSATLPTYPPPGDITHVLEVPGGWSEQNKIQVGAQVKF